MVKTLKIQIELAQLYKVGPKSTFLQINTSS